MVVAEDGYGYIGQSRDLVITSSMQTAAGRLLFARVDMADMGEAEREDALQESQKTHHRRSSHDEHGSEASSHDSKAGIEVRPAAISGPRVVEDDGADSGEDSNDESGSPISSGNRANAKGTARNPRR